MEVSTYCTKTLLPAFVSRSEPWPPGPARPCPPRQVLGPPAVLGSHWVEAPPDPLARGPDLQTEECLSDPHIRGPAHHPWLGGPGVPLASLLRPLGH